MSSKKNGLLLWYVKKVTQKISMLRNKNEGDERRSGKKEMDNPHFYDVTRDFLHVLITSIWRHKELRF